MSPWVRNGRYLGAVLICGLLAGAARAETAPVHMVLITTAKYTDEMRVVNGSLVESRPGHHAELLTEAAKRCGAEVEFSFAPWQRALLLVKSGDADGAFSSSYDEERLAYGVYPMANGKPDTTRALKGYSYSFYVPREWEDQPLSASGRPVAVERGAAVIPRIAQLGLSHSEVADNSTMLQMVARKRVAAAVLITAVADATLADNKELRAAIAKREPPIETKFGYVMLSKQFYASHSEVAECFWNKIRDIRATPRHAERVKAYVAESPAATRE
jgi:polar amino acid transport system substrate-binding protein